MKQRAELNTLLETHRAVILGECLSALRSVPRAQAAIDPEDVVQDVHLALCERVEFVLSSSNPKAYIRTVARQFAQRSVQRAAQCTEPHALRLITY